MGLELVTVHILSFELTERDPFQESLVGHDPWLTDGS